MARRVPARGALYAVFSVCRCSFAEDQHKKAVRRFHREALLLWTAAPIHWPFACMLAATGIALRPETTMTYRSWLASAIPADESCCISSTQLASGIETGDEAGSCGTVD